jgi:Flp pilus assembly protein TadD
VAEEPQALLVVPVRAGPGDRRRDAETLMTYAEVRVTALTFVVLAAATAAGCASLLYSEQKVAVEYDAAGFVGAFTANHAAALDGFQRVTRMRPGLAEGHYNVGVALANLGRWDEALAAFRRAAELKPALARAHLGVGLALDRLDRHDEALVAYRAAGRTDATSETIRLADLGYCTHYHRLPDGC